MQASSRPERIEPTVKRVDGAAKVTGRARYTADIFLPGMLVGRCLRSPYPSARIVSIDVSRAAALPGVHAVLTGADVPDTLFGRVVMDIPILAKRVVRFAGEKVAAVAAETPDIADEALSLIDVVYEELSAVTDAVEAMRETAHRVHDKPAKVSPTAASRVHGELRTYSPTLNVVSHLITRHGDFEAVLAQATNVFEHTFKIPSVHQGYLEPHSCIVDIDNGGVVNVWMSNKGPHVARLQLAETLNLPPDKVILHPVMIGGDFGGKGGLMDAPLCYYLALKARRPVRMVMSYFEELTAGNPRHAAAITLCTALDQNARILGVKAGMIFNTGAYAGFCPVITLHGYVTFGGAYRIPALALDLYRIHTNTVPAGHMRGPGGPQITFALESHFDIIAHELQIDPAKFRRENAISDGDLSPVGERRKFIRCRDTVDAATKAFGWSTPKNAHVGRGLALYEYPPGTYDRSSVRLEISHDGAITVTVGAPDTGTGFHTIVAQLVAEKFRIELDDVHVVQGDTSQTAYEKGASASRLTNTICQAIHDAADKAMARLIEWAAQAFGCGVDEVRHEEGCFRSTYGSLTLRALMAAGAARGQSSFVQTGENVSHVSSDVTCFATQIAEVEVDRETGQVTIQRIVTAHDVGKVVNPVTHQGQIEGGLVQGIGQAMSEQLHMRDGVVISASLGDYKMPCIKDIPVLETVLVPGEGGDRDMAKSIAEISNAAIIAAISNAIYDAVGVRLMELPITAEGIYDALRARGDHR